MLKLMVSGCKGKLGSAICRLSENAAGVTVAAGVDLALNNVPYPFPVYQDISECSVDADCIIDCSAASAVPSVIEYALKNKTPLVICTTGLPKETTELCEKASREIPVFRSANMSIGVNLLYALTEKLTKILIDTGFDIEIVERHHNHKADAPSGTALMLAEAVNKAAGGGLTYVYGRSPESGKRGKNELGLHAVRGGSIVGDHEVIFAGDNELLEIRHSAASRDIFAVGAIKAAKYTALKTPGLYDMQTLINES